MKADERNNVFQRRRYLEEWHRNKAVGLIGQFARDIKHSYQRITRGFSDEDTWDIDVWFLRIMADMLKHYKENRYGSPGELGENVVDGRGILVNEKCHEEWDRILDHMIYLLREADEETTSQVNAFLEEYIRASDRFTAEYGLFGERLEEQAETEDTLKHFVEGTKSGSRYHSMLEIPEYKEVWERYRGEEERIFAYRDRCKDEFLDLFKKWFWALWD